jgi:hypothetical protein
VGRGPNPQELMALLGALAVSTRLETLQRADKRIGLDCKSPVDYVNEHRHARMRNEVRKLPFLLAIQQYLQQDDAQKVRWARFHLERRKIDKQDFDPDEWVSTLPTVMHQTKGGQPVSTDRLSQSRRYNWYEMCF